MNTTNEEKSRMDKINQLAELVRNWMIKGNCENQPMALEFLEQLKGLALKAEAEHQTLATAAQGYMDRAAKLEGQRDHVQRELDNTIDQLLHATNECKDVRGLFVERGRRLSRMGEALAAAENDLADLRWLVRGAREGATLKAAPMLVLSTTGQAQVPPPPHVGGHNATAQAEGGAK